MQEPDAVQIDSDSPFGAFTPSLANRVAWAECAAHQAQGLPGKAKWKTLAREHRGPLDVNADGVKLRIYPTENFGDRQIAMTGALPEAEELALVAPHLPAGGTFIDIGANIGIYAILASRALGPRGRVLAFEPNARTGQKLAFNLAANACDNVTVHDCALGAEETTAQFFADGGKNAGRSSMLKEAVGDPETGVCVRVRPLSAVLAEEAIAAADLVKIDVEGYEDRVLVPYLAQVLPADLPRAILLEDAHRDLWAEDLTARLEAAGFRKDGATQTNKLYLRG
ncbi:FkbM family methyltransferase [Tepidamorphus sp. 3E244]|uniref:FkbM family methyltransferase n=1 Tax=Tepidamorphus sp. 3E244 TaxID=3385498 RepID=UPI0038FCA2D8